MSFAEVHVTIKNPEKSLKTSHTIHDTFTACDTDPIIRDLVDSTLKQFRGTPDDNTDMDEIHISVRINLEIK